MNTDEMIEKNVAKLIEKYSEVETEILKLLAQHFKDNKEFLNSDYWRIKKLEELGVFNEEVVQYIAKYSRTTQKMVEKAIYDVGFDTIKYNKLTTLYDGNVILKPEQIDSNTVLKSILKYAYDETSGNFITFNGKIKEAATQTYIDIVEKCYLETAMGVKSYDEAIKEALDELGARGIRIAEYQTSKGIRHYNIEGLARREILTNARKVNANLTMEGIKENQPEYIYISEHIACRPTHFDWQGTVVKREDFESVTNYGEVDGICGINCKHYFEPYYGDPDKVKKKYSKEECEARYKLTQKQRYLERGVRQWQQKEAVAIGSGNDKSIKMCDYKLNLWRKRLIHYCEDNDLQRDFTREYIYR